MKVIVNRSQYEKVITESRGYSKSVEKWGDYVTDELLSLMLKQDVDEDVYLLKKLSLNCKIHNQDQRSCYYKHEEGIFYFHFTDITVFRLRQGCC